MTTTATPTKPRQFCCHCLCTTRDYTTQEIQVTRDDIRRFHSCTDVSACNERRKQTAASAWGIR